MANKEKTVRCLNQFNVFSTTSLCSVQYLNYIVYNSQKLLEEEFLDSASGLTVQELMLQTSKYENGNAGK